MVAVQINTIGPLKTNQFCEQVLEVILYFRGGAAVCCCCYQPLAFIKVPASKQIIWALFLCSKDLPLGLSLHASAVKEKICVSNQWLKKLGRCPKAMSVKQANTLPTGKFYFNGQFLLKNAFIASQRDILFTCLAAWCFSFIFSPNVPHGAI